MAGIRFVSQVLNQREAPALYEDLRSKLPAPGFRGRIFFATDGTVGDTIYRDTGTLWEVLASNNPTVTGATNGLSLFGNDVGLGGTLVQNTQISGNNAYLIKFDDYTQFAIGNNIQPSLLLDTPNSKISTSYNGSIIGLSLDFANGQYWLGNSFFNGLGVSPNTGYYFLGDSQGNVPGLLNITILPNQLFILDVATGFANFIVNNAGTSASEVNLTIQNDSTLGDFIKTRYNNNDIGLKLDFANSLYQLGQLTGGNQTYLTVDDTNTIIKTECINLGPGGDAGIYIDFANGIYNLGDFNSGVNGTSLTINDATQKINLQSLLGLYNFANIPVYANNAAALAGGLLVGDIYRHSGGTGEQLHIVY